MSLTQFIKEKEVRERIDAEFEIPKMIFILAVNTSASLMNPERMKTTYKNVLIPLYDNLTSLFKKSCITNLEWSYEVEKHPNFGDGKESEGTFIWDALRVEFKITITDDCLRPIKL